MNGRAAVMVRCALGLLSPVAVPGQQLVPELRIPGEGEDYFLTEVLDARLAPDGSVVVQDRMELPGRSEPPMNRT